MFSNNTELASLITEKMGGGEYAFTDAVILGGAYTSTENPFDCFLVMNGAAHVSGDRWSGDEYGRMILNKHNEVEINVHMDADEMLLVDINADGIDVASHLVYDEVDITTPPHDGQAEFKEAEQVYRLITSKSQGAAAMSKIVLRLEDIDPNNQAPQPDWEIAFIKVWKVTVS